jgi:transcriptional regulator with XRE-family HTH domain
MYFGDKLRALRLKRNLTQQQLADMTELTKSSISAYERNAKYPSIDVLIRLCSYFRVSSDYMIGLSDIDRNIPLLTDEQTMMITQLITEFDEYNKVRADSLKKCRKCGAPPHGYLFGL